MNFFGVYYIYKVIYILKNEFKKNEDENKNKLLSEKNIPNDNNNINKFKSNPKDIVFEKNLATDSISYGLENDFIFFRHLI